jgi:uncharacterized protein YndB with AHSA1/START domain
MPKYQLGTPSDREIILTRTLDALRQPLLYASTKPEMAKRWLLPTAQWPMAHREREPRLGGKRGHLWDHWKRRDRA